MIGLSTIKTYALAALGITTAVLYALFQREKAKGATRDKQDAEAQRDVLIKAEEGRKQAHQEGEKRKDEAIKKSDAGDFSGFNDGV